MKAHVKDASKLLTILIVDDSAQNLQVLGELLRPLYHVRVANSGEQALQAAKTLPQPDLITLDIMMNNMGGYEVIKQLKSDSTTMHIPVIFVTAMGSYENEEQGLALGAVDYINKPINPTVTLARIQTQLELKKARDILSCQNEYLEREIEKRMSENVLIQNVNIRALASLAEARDKETGHHIIRTQYFVKILGEHLLRHPKYNAELVGRRLNMMVQAAPLHDIGKVGIADAILCKPGRLTADEFQIMKQHTIIGEHAIKNAIQQTLESVDEKTAKRASQAFEFLYVAAEIAKNHHEKWDGSGYPLGISQEQIPLAARIMALADVFDALTARRVYKSAITIDNTTEMICKGRGTHFDPDIVDAFLACHEQFVEVAERYKDKDSQYFDHDIQQTLFIKRE